MHRPATLRRTAKFALALLTFAPTLPAGAQASPAATAAFDAYTRSVEARLAQQHRSPTTFLTAPAATPQDRSRLRSGELILEQLTPKSGSELPGALLHHWRGTAFVPGVTAAGFERLLRDVNAYPRLYAPQVIRAKLLAQDGDHLQASMRVRQHHVLTVVLDTAYDITFGRLDPQHGYSTSRSTRIAEIDSPGAPNEHPLIPADDHGFLWRLNTYWTYEERDGGLYLQIETVSLTRSIPHGLAWAVEPFIQTIPRESLAFTLSATRNGLLHQPTTTAALR